MLNIVVSCTYRKRRVGGASKLAEDQTIKLRDFHGTLQERIDLWWEALQTQDSPKLPARDLYAGDHWSTSLQLADISKSRGLKSRLWVCSAGYGLLPVDAPLKPYSASFSPGPDSVHRPKGDPVGPSDANEIWWGLLAQQNFLDGPRSISELHTSKRNSRLIVVASERYLRALRADLKQKCTDDPDRVLLISAGYPNGDDLSPCLLPADARLQPSVGGVLQTMNARLARIVLHKIDPGEGFESTRKRFRARLRRAPDRIQYDRKPMSDHKVKAFIAREIKALASIGQKACHSPLLRTLRDSGNACEQKRFRQLFFEVEKKVNA